MTYETASPIESPVEFVSESTRKCIACENEQLVRLLVAPDRFHGRKEQYQLVRCSLCSLVWLENPPRPEEMGQHYGPDYDRTVAEGGDGDGRWKDHAKVIAQYKTGGSLLDLGCSAGGFLQTIKSSSWTLSGIEMSQEVASKAERRTGAQVFVGDILDAPYAPESFDVITCFHVFEHLYKPEAVLKKVTEWLKPGGIFYVIVPNIDSAGAHVFKSYWYALELPRHLFHFSPKSLSKLVKAQGFDEVSVKTTHEVFLEKSVGYLYSEMFERTGFPRVPPAKAKQPGIPFRVVRKACRMTLIPMLSGVAALAGDGEIIHGIFRKKVVVSNGAA